MDNHTPQLLQLAAKAGASLHAHIIQRRPTPAPHSAHVGKLPVPGGKAIPLKQQRKYTSSL
jgi:hypothetical protein